MLQAVFRSPAARLRLTRRPVLGRSRRLAVQTLHPSLLDLRFTGDTWIVRHSDGRLGLCLGNLTLAHIDGLNLDLPSLNTLLDRARNRKPR